MPASLRTLIERCNSYLGNGGFFNPEMMDHQKVGALLLDMRDFLAALPPSPPQTQELQEIRALTKTTGKVTNGVTDDVECIRGLQERVKFTQDYESLQFRLAASPPAHEYQTDGTYLGPDRKRDDSRRS